MIRYLRWAPAVAWMAVIFYWSEQPVLPIDGRPDTDQLHLVGHVVAYGILALLLPLGTGTTPRGLIAALAIATIYGALDEAHQSFVPGRQARLQDVALDAASAAAALASFTILRGLLVDSARPPGAPPGRGGRMGRFALALVAVAAIGGALLGYNLQVGSEGNESPGRANVQQAERVPAKQGERAAPARQVPNTPVRTSAKQAFLVDLAEPELLALVRPRTAEGTGELPVRNFDLKVTTEGVLLKGELTEGLPLPMTASLAPFVNAGKLDPGVQEVRVGQLRVPADRLLGPILRAFDVNEQLQASGEVMLQDVQLRDGAVRLVGLYGEGALVDGEVVLELRRQVASGQAVDGTDRPWMAAFAGTAISAHEGAANGWGGGMYVALGDSSALVQRRVNS